MKLFGEKMTAESYELKKRIGLVMQEVGVYEELTVEENIVYFCSLYISDKHELKESVEEVLDFVQLKEVRKSRPRQLSGGMLRRLNLACGIAHKPERIILDEPTVAIDAQSRRQILEGIKELSRRGKTVLYTTHYMEEVEFLCDRLTIMDKGRELVSGTQRRFAPFPALGRLWRRRSSTFRKRPWWTCERWSRPGKSTTTRGCSPFSLTRDPADSFPYFITWMRKALRSSIST